MLGKLVALIVVVVAAVTQIQAQSNVILPLCGNFNEIYMYYVHVNVGTPGNDFTVVVDTGRCVVNFWIRSALGHVQKRTLITIIPIKLNKILSIIFNVVFGSSDLLVPDVGCKPCFGGMGSLGLACTIIPINCFNTPNRQQTILLQRHEFFHITSDLVRQHLAVQLPVLHTRQYVTHSRDNLLTCSAREVRLHHPIRGH